jgi:lauroyl/myristoyl acyltransferase
MHARFIELCRVLARFLPPLVLHALLVPYEWLRGAGAAMAVRVLPLHDLTNPEASPPRFVTRWRYQSRNYERWLATQWPELWRKPPWSARLTVDHPEIVERLLADKPVVLATLHTGWPFACTRWLLNQGVEIGAVVAGAEAWQRTLELRETDYWARHAGVHVFPHGDARAMVRFLTPGRCFLIQVDYGRGEVIDIEWGGRHWRLATGAFRVARLANAAVVPIVGLDDGIWRTRAHVGTPVPHELISAGNDAASATHVMNELMPLMAQVPDQLMGWQPRPATDSGLGDPTLADY